jgi:hypothetical protein
MLMPNDWIEKTRGLEGIGELCTFVHGLDKSSSSLSLGREGGKEALVL